MLADGERWRGGLAPPCPRGSSQQAEQQAVPGWIFRTHKLCSSRFRPYIRRWIRAWVCSDIINLGCGVTFLGQISFCGASEEPVRWPHEVVYNLLYQKKKPACKEKVVGIVVGQLVLGTSCPV